MDISARTDYAVRAMLLLAQASRDDTGPVSVERLAAAQDLPRKFLEAVVGDLRSAGLVESRRGAGGGYVLARPAGDIAVGDVFRAVSGPLAEVRGLRPQDTSYSGVAEGLPALWVAVRSGLREVLDRTSIEDVRLGRLPQHVRRLVESPDAWDNR